MSPKPFTLDSVLTFRKREENLAQEQFSQARLAVEKAEERLEIAKQEQEQLILTLEKEQKKGLLALEQARFEERIQYSSTQIQLLKNALKEKTGIAEKKRNNLIKKSKEFKILDALKEQQNKAWKDYLNKKEAAMLDEIAILHHDRKAKQ